MKILRPDFTPAVDTGMRSPFGLRLKRPAEPPDKRGILTVSSYHGVIHPSRISDALTVGNHIALASSQAVLAEAEEILPGIHERFGSVSYGLKIPSSAAGKTRP